MQLVHKLFFIVGICFFVPLMSMDIDWRHVQRSNFENCAKAGFMICPLQLEAKQAIDSHFGQKVKLSKNIREKIKQNYVDVMIGHGNCKDLTFGFDRYLGACFKCSAYPKDSLSFPQLNYFNWRQWHGLSLLAKLTNSRLGKYSEQGYRIVSEQECEDAFLVPDRLRFYVLRYLSDKDCIVQLDQRKNGQQNLYTLR